ncbi:hypothetical protein JTB14_008466 [Gonioctena quinquepunctata]|nr:hypothetical protein JTB14_008466 [Gonioctena quinquepunctata]
MYSQASTTEKRQRPSNRRGCKRSGCWQSVHKENSISVWNIKSQFAKIIKKSKNTGEKYVHRPNIGNKRIFSKAQKDSLVSYPKTAQKMCHGLTIKQTGELAFQYAEANNICLEKWKVDKDLSVRKTESSSLSRVTSFKKTNVSTFSEKLTSIYT